MAIQRFIAHQRFYYPNGAIGWAPGGPFDCLGPYAKVQNCPVMLDGHEVKRLTCYATGYADTFFSIPAATQYKGRYIGGFFTREHDGSVVFRVNLRHAERMER